HEIIETLDTRARGASEPDTFTADVTLAFALWQSVSTRIDELTTTWDSGRVGRIERDRVSDLIWGAMDRATAGAPLRVTFVEACTLAVSVAPQLAARLDADGLGR